MYSLYRLYIAYIDNTVINDITFLPDLRGIFTDFILNNSSQTGETFAIHNLSTDGNHGY